MPLGFPTNPTPGQTYTIGTKTYTWNGSAWLLTSGSATAVTATSVYATGTVTVANTTTSTGTNSGALVVQGGAGVGGDLYVGGNVYAASTGSTINFTTGTFDQLFVTGTYDSDNTITGALQVVGGVGIGGDLYVGGQFFAGGGLVLTTASFNNSFNAGDDISLTLTSGSVIVISNTSTIQSVTSRGNSTTNQLFVLNTTQSTSTDTGAVVISGGLGVAKRITAESLRIQDAVFDSTETLVNTTNPTVIDTYNVNEFRGAKYLIQIDEGTGPGADFELIEILLVADNDGNAWATEYGVVTSNGYLGEFDAEYVGGNVSLYFTAYNATNKTVKVLRTGMAT